LSYYTSGLTSGSTRNKTSDTKNTSKDNSFEMFKWNNSSYKQYYSSQSESRNQPSDQSKMSAPIEQPTHSYRPMNLAESSIELSPEKGLETPFSYLELSNSGRKNDLGSSYESTDQYEGMTHGMTHHNDSFTTMNQRRISLEQKARDRRIEIKPANQRPSSEKTIPDGYYASMQAGLQKTKKNYKPYSFKDFQNMQQGDKQTKRGGLGAQKAPDNESLKLKRKTDYAEGLRARHKETIRVRDEIKPDPKEEILAKKHEQRRKILEFAATVPRPKKPTASSVGRAQRDMTRQDNIVYDQGESDLDRLLARHKTEQARVQRLNQLSNIN